MAQWNANSRGGSGMRMRSPPKMSGMGGEEGDAWDGQLQYMPQPMRSLEPGRYAIDKGGTPGLVDTESSQAPAFVDIG